MLGAGFRITARDKTQAAALSQQAFVTFQSGDYPQALSELVQSDQLNPDQPDGWNLRGMIFLKQKAYDKAEAAFARATALDPSLWAAQFNLAEVFFQRKDYAGARARFERLLSQTDRFKQATRWELVQYKIIVSSLLLGDDQTAGKKLARLPGKGAATPALLYAQAALAFHRKDSAQAQRALASAQTAYPAAMNDLFSDSLVQAGWQLPPMPVAALAANVPAVPPNTLLNQTSAPLPTDARDRAYVVDPQLQAASAGPLPVADTPTQPIVKPMTPALRGTPPLPESRPVPAPAPAVVAGKPTVPPADAGDGLEHGGLLLDE